MYVQCYGLKLLPYLFNSLNLLTVQCERTHIKTATKCDLYLRNKLNCGNKIWLQVQVRMN